jgi:hypothetical protein
MLDDEEIIVARIPLVFVACTCDHEPREHGWVKCNARGCPCTGHWEE